MTYSCVEWMVIYNYDNAALWTVLTVCPSFTPFFTIFLSLYHHEYFTSPYHWQKSCQRKTSKSEVKGKVIKVEFTDGYEIVPKVWICIEELP